MTATTLNKTENVVLFDGICNLCNGAVNFIIDRDKQGKFQFAALQSDYGQQFLKASNLPEDIFESMVFQQGDKAYFKSTAALKIARQMDGLWPLMYAFIIVPRFIRDGIYNLIAKNRYSMFGKRDQCRIPTPELKSRFIG